MQELAIEYYIRNFFALSENDKDNALLALSKISEHVLEVMNVIFTQMVMRSKLFDSESFKLQRCMIQYMAGKHLAIHSFVTTKHIVSINDVPNVVYDYTPAISIVRSMFEMLLIHHAIFVTANTEEERTFLINIWKYKGLKFPAETTGIDTQEMQEARQVRNQFLQEIKRSPLFDENDFKATKSNSIVYFSGEGKKRHLTSCSFTNGWKLLQETEEFRHKSTQDLYARLCTETHVTYMGLMMYEQQNQMTPSPQLAALYLSCSLFSYMLLEIMAFNDDYKKAFEALDVIQKKIFWTFLDVL